MQLKNINNNQQNQKVLLKNIIMILKKIVQHFQNKKKYLPNLLMKEVIDYLLKLTKNITMMT